MAVAIRQDGQLQPAQDVVGVWRDRIEAAKRARKRYETQWQLSAARAAGKFWLEVSRNSTDRRLMFPRDLQKRVRNGLRLYTADLLTQYIWAGISILGEGGEFRSQVAFNDDDLQSEDFAEQANQALEFAWQSEIDADAVVDDILLGLMVYGTVGGRCRFDPTVGPVYLERAVWLDGRPLLDPAQADAAVAASFSGQGPRVEIRPLRGRITWDYLTPWQLLPPGAVSRERRFPWEVVVTPTPISSVVAEYPQARGLEPQKLAATDMLGLRDVSEYDLSPLGEDGTAGDLNDHILVYTCYERPTPEKPQGQVVTLAGKEYRPLEVRDTLPYRAPSGADWRSGVTYFHLWRVADRFWSRSLVDIGGPLVKAYSRRRTQMSETIDRGQPWVAAEEGALPGNKMPQGLPMEVVKFASGRRPPQHMQGIGPGPWMVQELQIMREELAEATGIRDVSLGENPANVQTYSQLVLLEQQDKAKWQPPANRLRAGISRMIEDTLYDISTYWPPDKQIAIAGEDGQVQAFQFNSSQMPEAYYVRAAKGNALPKNQAAQLQKITDITRYCLEVGFPLPPSWYVESLEAGKAMALPDVPADAHRDKARFENQRMQEQPEPLPISYYDDDQTHLIEHRTTQIQMEIAGRSDVAMVIDEHAQQHMRKQMLMMQAQAEAQMQAVAGEQAQAEGEAE